MSLVAKRFSLPENTLRHRAENNRVPATQPAGVETLHPLYAPRIAQLFFASTTLARAGR